MDEVMVIPADFAHLKAVVAIARQDVQLLGWVPTSVFVEAIKAGHILVAVQGDRVYGFVEYGGLTQDNWTIYKIASARPVRGKGVGSLILQTLIEEAASIGKGLKLKVTEDNAAAIDFYQRHGFKIKDIEQSKQRKVFLMEREV